jgi:hypothetical protein
MYLRLGAQNRRLAKITKGSNPSITDFKNPENPEIRTF